MLNSSPSPSPENGGLGGKFWNALHNHALNGDFVVGRWWAVVGRGPICPPDFPRRAGFWSFSASKSVLNYHLNRQVLHGRNRQSQCDAQPTVAAK